MGRSAAWRAVACCSRGKGPARSLLLSPSLPLRTICDVCVSLCAPILLSFRYAFFWPVSPPCSALSNSGDPDALEHAAAEMSKAAARLVAIERNMLELSADDGADVAAMATKQARGGVEVCVCVVATVSLLGLQQQTPRWRADTTHSWACSSRRPRGQQQQQQP